MNEPKDVVQGDWLEQDRHLQQFRAERVRKLFLVRSPGFEPGITSLEGSDEQQWNSFKKWVFAKYSKVYAGMVYCYARKYYYLLNGNLSCLESLKSEYAKTHVVRSLVVLSKFLGKSQDFRKKLKDFGIKTYKPDSFASFLRILSARFFIWLFES